MKFLNAANGVSNSVLNIVQMGVVAFTDNGTLLFNNKTCLKKLRVEELPQSFIDFVQTFVHDEQVLLDLQVYESLLPKQRPQENEDISSKARSLSRSRPESRSETGSSSFILVSRFSRSRH